MKNNSKGFTLIELLAVIVILAVIALIATPIVLNLIDKARKGAAESGAYAYIEAAEKAAVVDMMTNTRLKVKGDCTVGATGNTLTCAAAKTDGTDSDETISLTVDLKGDLPAQNGTVTFDATGSVSGASLTINGYAITYTPANGATAS